MKVRLDLLKKYIQKLFEKRFFSIVVQVDWDIPAIKYIIFTQKIP